MKLTRRAEWFWDWVRRVNERLERELEGATKEKPEQTQAEKPETKAS